METRNFYLSILKGGVQAWNRWRADHPAAQPDLVGVDFSAADLPFMTDIPDDPFDGYVQGLAMENARLCCSRIDSVCLRNSCFDGADLAQASLHDTTFIDSSFQRATLRNADLRGARFVRCNFSFADLAGATLGSTQWE